MSVYAFVGALAVMWAVGAYVGFCFGYVAARWDSRVRRWCDRRLQR